MNSYSRVHGRKLVSVEGGDCSKQYFLPILDIAQKTKGDGYFASVSRPPFSTQLGGTVARICQRHPFFSERTPQYFTCWEEAYFHTDHAQLFSAPLPLLEVFPLIIVNPRKGLALSARTTGQLGSPTLRLCWRGAMATKG